MSSLILRTGARLLFPLLLLFSLFLLLRGHDAPGGGFSGGLVAAAAFVLFGVAYGVPATRQVLRVDPHALIGVGLLAALASGLPALVAGEPFMVGRWWEVALGGIGPLALGTPLLFDVGVYLVVVGVTLLIILTLSEEAT